jgi:hypothetical protein
MPHANRLDAIAYDPLVLREVHAAFTSYESRKGRIKPRVHELATEPWGAIQTLCPHLALGSARDIRAAASN